jgi:hypothetical protein
MTIRKLRAGRIATANAATWIGDAGTIFYDEITGTLKIADGETPGGKRIVLNAEDINLAFGDFVADNNNLSTVQPNQDFNLISNGIGSINIVGEFHIHTTVGGLSSDPIFVVKADGQSKFIIPDPDNLEGAVSIIGNPSGIYQSPVNTGVMFHITGQEGIPSRSYNDSLGDYAGFVGRRANGTPTNPTQVLANQEVTRYAANAFTDAGYQSFGIGQLRWYANENQTLNARGGRAEIWVTPNGSTTAQLVAKFEPVNGVTASKFTGDLYGNVYGVASSLKGSVVSSNTNLTVLDTTNPIATFTGNTTGIHTGLVTKSVRNAGIIADNGTLTVNFATDDIITCSWGNGLNIVYTNYTAGRIVKVIATKITGTGTDSISLDGVLPAQVSTGVTTLASGADTSAFIELISTSTTINGLYIKI